MERKERIKIKRKNREEMEERIMTGKVNLGGK